MTAPVQVLADDDAAARTTAAGALEREAQAAGRHVVHIRNPLRSPLTLDRVLMQVAGPDDAPDASPQALAASILRRHGAAGGVLLLAEAADTLHPAALRTLLAMAALPAPDGVPVALVGGAGLRAALDADEFAPYRALISRVGEGGPSPSAPVTVLRTAPPPRDAPPAPPLAVIPPPPVAVRPAPAKLAPLVAPVRPKAERRATAAAGHRASSPRRGGWLVRGALAALVLCGVGIAAVQGMRSVFYREAPPRPVLANVVAAPPPPAAAPAPAAPLTPAPAPAAPPSPPAAAAPPQSAALPPLLPALPPPAQPTPEPPTAADPPPLPTVIVPELPPPVAAPATPAPAGPQPVPLDQTARLRREFEAFLARSGRGVASLTEEQRAALFEEYLQWRAQNPGNAPRQATSAPPARIVLHVPAGSAEADRQSVRVQQALRSRAAVETRLVSDGPQRPTVLFFHRADEAAARQAAEWMSAAGLAWTVRDMTATAPKPEPGLLEAWLPDR